jgi:phenylpropionate dioxygenase-like ring-hydroxylating dioxygenase large terminal subunit
MPPREHWYIAARAPEVGRRPVGRTLLGDRLVLFRDADARPAALADQCRHRNMALSAGRVVGGCLECPYHGWRYDGEGRCTLVPSLGVDRPPRGRPSVRAYPAVESDGYVWVFMGEGPVAARPFRFPHLGEAGWTTFRMRTRFGASAFACVENFLDCPHTAFVHRGWFRTRDARQLRARVRRWADRVEVDFVDEAPGRSVVSELFFPSEQALAHSDRFFLPAISRVDYRFGPSRHFIITSQCTPVSEHETLVETVITFRFGRVAPLVRLLFEPVCRWIIRQDVAILARQTAQLRLFGGPRFVSTESDLFARHIEALWRCCRRTTPAADEPAAAPAGGPEVDVQVAIRF